jgi:hypothetical protein
MWLKPENSQTKWHKQAHWTLVAALHFGLPSLMKQKL